MYSEPKGNKCCLTCINWNGPRKERLGGVETDSVSTKGKCRAGVFTSDSAGFPASHKNCDKYVKL